MRKAVIIKLNVIIISLFILISASSSILESAKKETKETIEIYVKHTFGYEKHVVDKLEDFFQLEYACGQPQYKISHFKRGNILKSKDQTGPLYYIISYRKFLSKNKIIVIVTPFIVPDPRRMRT